MFHTLVVYKKSNRSGKEKLYGVEGVHYINTSHQEVYEALGMYYTSVIVEDGVSEEEKDFCMKRLVSKEDWLNSSSFTGKVEEPVVLQVK